MDAHNQTSVSELLSVVPMGSWMHTSRPSSFTVRFISVWLASFFINTLGIGTTRNSPNLVMSELAPSHDGMLGRTSYRTASRTTLLGVVENSSSMIVANFKFIPTNRHYLPYLRNPIAFYAIALLFRGVTMTPPSGSFPFLINYRRTPSSIKFYAQSQLSGSRNLKFICGQWPGSLFFIWARKPWRFARPASVARFCRGARHFFMRVCSAARLFLSTFQKATPRPNQSWRAGVTWHAALGRLSPLGFFGDDCTSRRPVQCPFCLYRRCGAAVAALRRFWLHSNNCHWPVL